MVKWWGRGLINALSYKSCQVELVETGAINQTVFDKLRLTVKLLSRYQVVKIQSLLL
jgi:hypothetical protein